MQFQVQATIKRQGLIEFIRTIFYIIFYSTFFAGIPSLIFICGDDYSTNGIVIKMISFVIYLFVLIFIIGFMSKIVKKRNMSTMTISGSELYIITKRGKRIQVNLLERQYTKNLKVINYTYSNRIFIKIKNVKGRKIKITGNTFVRNSVIPMLINQGIKVTVIYDEPSDD